MKKTFLLLASILMLAVFSCKKSLLPTKTTGQESMISSSVTTTPYDLPMWHKTADNPVDRKEAFGFTINSRGYVGGGLSSNSIFVSGWGSVKSLYEYEPHFNVWVKRADLPGYSTENTASFVIGNKAYISTGHHSYTGPDTSLFDRNLKDTWEYDQATDKWTKKADFPGGARKGAVGMSINGKGYVGLGSTEIYLFGNLSTIRYNDWWEYDPLTDIWTKKKNFPGAAREDAVACAVGSFGYLGTGLSSTGFMADWWRYDAATDSWTQRTSLPGVARKDAVAFITINLSGSKLYIATGGNDTDPSNYWLNDVWRYDPVANQWAQSFSMPFGRYQAACFMENNTVYVGGGTTEAHDNVQPSPTSYDYWSFQF